MSRGDQTAHVQLTLPPAAKITPPRIPEVQVHRDRLLARLTDTPQDHVVTVSAPAGSGKTQLLAAWVATRTDPTAWVTLDHRDNDKRRFWSAIVSALLRCAQAPPAVDLERLGEPMMVSVDAAYIAVLVDSIRATPSPVTLILDDLHPITDPAVRRALTELITYCQPQLRLVLVGRGDLPVRLGRLRLEERILELRGPDLAFTVEEAEQLVIRAGLTLSADQVRRLTAQTAGWAAGLRLAALAMRRNDPATILTDLVGSTATISDYLVDEVLSGLGDEARLLLDCIAVCGQVTAPLAQQISGVQTAGTVLADLESSTSLIISFGDERRWFQLHPLLQSHLLVDIHRFRPEVELDLHRRAVAWFEQHGDIDRALRHGIRSGDPDLSGPVLRRYGLRLLESGHHGTLRAAASTFRELFSSDAWLALLAALAHLEIAGTRAARRFADRATDAWPSAPAADLVAMARLVDNQLVLLGEKPSMVLAVESPPEEAAVDRPLSALVQATGAAIDGDVEAFGRLADEVVTIGRNTGNDYLTAHGMVLLTLATALTGDLAATWTMADRVGSVDPTLWRGTTDDALVRLFQAQVALFDGEPERCQQLIGRLTASNPTIVAVPLQAWLRLLAGTATFDRGERIAGLNQLADARTTLEGKDVPPSLVALHAAFEHDAAQQLNHTDQARDVVRWAGQKLPDCADVRFLRAHSAAQISRFGYAQTQLNPILTGQFQPLNPPVRIQAWVLTSWIRIRLREHERALTALTRALDEANTQRVLRPLLRAPTEVLDLLSDQLGSWGRHDGMVELILAKRPPTPSPVNVALTPREQQVLILLQGLLSLDEIADDLTVSPNTIKTHVRAIYTKLGVGSRRDAIRAARNLGLV